MMRDEAKIGVTIDAHHHLWRYSATEYGWIDESMAELRRDFATEDLERELAAANVDGTIAVQARQSDEETRWLLSLARETPRILGVVGWAEIAAEDFGTQVEHLATGAAACGIATCCAGRA